MRRGEIRLAMGFASVVHHYEYVDGWISDCGSWGAHGSVAQWKITHIESGLCVLRADEEEVAIACLEALESLPAPPPYSRWPEPGLNAIAFLRREAPELAAFFDACRNGMWGLGGFNAPWPTDGEMRSP